MAKRANKRISDMQLMLRNFREHKSIDTAAFNDDRSCNRLITALERNEMITAIKEIRALCECGLREAKDIYDNHIRAIK